MRKILVAALLLGACGPAMASTVVFDNPSNFAQGDCSYSTTCAADVGRGDDFAAQLFTLSSGVTLTGGSVTNFMDPSQSGANPTSINWKFLAADGLGGLPGTSLFSGSSVVTSHDSVGSLFGFYDASKSSFALPNVSLAAGNYYFAVQAVSGVFQTYLSQGVLPGGAAESFDGGASWNFGYENLPSVAVSLSSGGAVPEPASWAMMLGGFGAIGGAMRARRKAAVSFA